MGDAVAQELVRIVGVRFKRAGKIYYFDPGELDLVRGDRVLVETSAGVEFGEVVVPVKMVPESDVVPPIRPVLREVVREDYDRLIANRQDERVAQQVANERIAARGLPMRLVNTEYTFDRNRLTFFFTADSRVDFRQLVRDLARQFGVRIELRQIGVRDEAKEFGGIGLCGRELCCSSWLGEFQPVSIRMAKEQRLSLNPSKLTGQCGRLKCCLKYENDTYRQIRSELPEVGDRVQTVVGGETVAGRVIEVLVTRESVEVDVGEGRRVLVSTKQIESGEAVVLTGKLARGGGAALDADQVADAVERDEDTVAGRDDAAGRVEPVAERGEGASAGGDGTAASGGVDVADDADAEAVPGRKRRGAHGARDAAPLGRAAGADEHAAAAEVDDEGEVPGGRSGAKPKRADGAGAPRRRRRRRPRRRPRPDQAAE